MKRVAHPVGLTRVALLALVPLLSACEDGPMEAAPEVAFDANAALTDYEAVARLMEVASVRGFGGVTARLPRAGAASRVAGAAAVPIISEGSRGSTFVYDPGRDEYVRDPERAGAPANGVRFILYEVDEQSGRPLVDQEIGHADLFDLGDDFETGISLRFVVTTFGVTSLDYVVTQDGDESAVERQVAGVISDGTDALEFEIGVFGSIGEGFQRHRVQFAIGMPTRGFSVLAEVENERSPDHDAGSVSMDVAHGDQSVAVEIVRVGATLEGAFSVNGTLIAEASGNAEDPTLTGPNGSALTFSQIRAFTAILHLQEDVFHLLDGLMRPAEEIIELGIVL